MSRNAFDKRREAIRTEAAAAGWRQQFTDMRLRAIDRDEERALRRQLREATRRLNDIVERRQRFKDEREQRESTRALRRDLRRSLRCYLPLPEGMQ